MKRWTQWLCPAVFVVAIFAGAAAMLFQPKKTYSEREKRYLAELPTLTWATLEDGTAQTQWEKWLGDHFPARDVFVGLNAYEKLLTGRNALEKIYFARENYLINAPTALDMALFTTNLQRFDNFAKNTGLPASLVLVPSTGSMKEALLPMGHGPYPDDQLFETARETVTAMTACDLRQQLAQADAAQPVFYHTDHHLTAYGAYTLYAAWREAQGLSARPQSDYTVTSYDGFYGTTWSGSGYFLTPPDTVELWDSGLTPTVTITDGGRRSKTQTPPTERSWSSRTPTPTPWPRSWRNTIARCICWICGSTAGASRILCRSRAWMSCCSSTARPRC